jgi:hypothetical protein
MKVIAVGWISVSRIHRASADAVDAAHAYPPYIFSENKFTLHHIVAAARDRCASFLGTSYDRSGFSHPRRIKFYFTNLRNCPTIASLL